MTTTWHDLRDQLTDDQLSLMEHTEARSPDHPGLIKLARKYAQENLTQTWLADVPVPAGAVTVSDWIDEGDRVIRVVDGTTRGDVQIIGIQHEDGTVDWSIFDGGVAHSLDMARKRVEDLAATVDEVDRLSR